MALFNEIDKYFDLLLGKTDSFMPFNEKLKVIAHGGYPISKFIKLHDHTLKYLGELRNMISHGLRVSGEVYAQPSAFAIQQIKSYKDAILTPPTVLSCFHKDVYVCTLDSRLSKILIQMKERHIWHVPVYKDEDMIGVITLDTLLEWFGDHLNGNQREVRVEDMTVYYYADQYKFIDPSTSIYVIEQLFEQERAQGNVIEAIFLTPDGKASRQLHGIITASDIPLIMNKLLLTQ